MRPFVWTSVKITLLWYFAGVRCSVWPCWPDCSRGLGQYQAAGCNHKYPPPLFTGVTSDHLSCHKSPSPVTSNTRDRPPGRATSNCLPGHSCTPPLQLMADQSCSLYKADRPSVTSSTVLRYWRREVGRTSGRSVSSPGGAAGGGNVDLSRVLG